MSIEILEKNARRAKETSSFSDYNQGSATAEYESYCESAEKAANWAIEKLEANKAPQERMERVTYLLEKYKTKKLEWMIAVYANRASVPSVMIAGPSNFPVRKKEQQNVREKSLYENDPDYIIDQIRSVGHDAKVIRSDDKNAVERIKEKIANLETAPPDAWGYNKTEIRRLKERLLALAPEEFAEEQENITVNGVKTYEEIAALWESGKSTKSEWSDTMRYYWNLPLDFYNGKRHYKEFIQVEVDEVGKNIRRYNITTSETDVIPLTTEKKYALIIGKISGSGNKAVIYQYLRGLMPSVQASQKKAEEREEIGENEIVTINGEAAQIVINKEDMRLQVIFDGKPEVKTRERLKSNGFRWAPSVGAWQRLLNSNATYALKQIIDK